MKKLDLKLGSIKELLSKDEMKKVNGGYEPACYTDCETEINFWCCLGNDAISMGSFPNCLAAAYACEELKMNSNEPYSSIAIGAYCCTV